MTNPAADPAAEICVPCNNLASTLHYFTETLGFRVEMIFPADAPHTAVISASGVRLRLEESSGVASQPFLRIQGDQPSPAASNGVAPGGMRIEFVQPGRSARLPGGAINNEFVLTRFDADRSAWNAGRAGMQYRDLIPSRLGGRFIASHIRIPDGGEVPDYVHFHKVRFQLIFCVKGWARLVYEGQGEPFLMRAGDCVLQPPEIRHRVLEASAGLEVIEIGCPAIHETWADHDMPLPTNVMDRNKVFSGQTFVHHQASGAAWRATTATGWASQETVIRLATQGLAHVQLWQASANAVSSAAAAPAVKRSFKAAPEFHFLFVLSGTAKLTSNELGEQYLSENDCCVLPAGVSFQLGLPPATRSSQPGCQILDVHLPAG